MDGNSERRKYDEIFRRLDRYMREERIYLDYDMTVARAAEIVGTNRTYISRSLSGRYKNFKNYINSFRVRDFLCDITENEDLNHVLNEDPDDFARKYGFRTRRSLDRIMINEKGCTYRKYLHRMNLGKDFTD